MTAILATELLIEVVNVMDSVRSGQYSYHYQTSSTLLYGISTSVLTQSVSALLGKQKDDIGMTGFSLDSAAGNETLLLILDVYFAQAFVTGHCHLIRCSLKKCYQAV